MSTRVSPTPYWRFHSINSATQSMGRNLGFAITWHSTLLSISDSRPKPASNKPPLRSATQ
ncbi:hypothetical protein BDP55DRAFT_681882 [Colletotrichum godetiae]|uniref:Uncharacterized protein n=1 Tax=Colletotrichum godetiae TaxID=1209918 RepID=A0AAJ0A8X7_9PEZI|nr:uncharacterized protein BDP55DRAFT_681882 [Colletotrichum godetiae]KAK1658685.1 hypothetical protein BDP55DRAFT_681882 [Colletotrichum godetiae]